MTLRNLRSILAPALFACLVAACAETNPAALVASAKSYLERQDYPAAIIQLKNALQREPENGEARFLLARALLQSGSAAAAETEARKAIEFKYAADEASPLLARTLVAQEQYRKLIEEFSDTKLSNPAAQAELLASLAVAWQQSNEANKALATIDEALAIKPDSTRALVVKARLVAQRRDLEGALKLVDAALAATPLDPDASVLKADLLSSLHRRDEAIATLESAAAAHPADIATRFALIGHFASGGKLDQATSVLEAMKKASPKDMRTVYSDALVAYLKHDATRARDLVQQILAVRPEHVQSLYLSGLINYELKSYAAAEDALRRVLAKAPGEPAVTRALAALYLRSGRATSAREVLEPALRRSPDDAALLRVAGEAWLQSADPVKAAQFYERANAVDKDNVASEVRLAQIRFAGGDEARAFTELDALSKAEADNTQPDLALFSIHLRRRAFDKALDAAATIEKKQPESATGPFLRGVVYLSKRDLANARSNFERALSVQPSYVPAAHNLALLDIQDGKPEAARARYEALLAKDPKNEDVLLALADLIAMTGGSADQRKAAIERAIAENPQSVRPRLVLIRFYMQSGDARAALAAAQAGEAAFRNDPAMIEAVGTAQLAAGESNQAVETFKRLTQLSPQSAGALLRLANAHLAAKDYDSSIEATRKALAINADLAQGWSLLIKAYLASGKSDDAVAEARRLQRDRPDRALGYLLETEIFAQQKQWAQAAKAANEGLAREAVPMLAVARYVALTNADKASEAQAGAERWVKEHPKDLAMRAFLAQQAQQRGDYRAAAVHYRSAAEVDADNVTILNNLAWVLGETGDPGARDVAERAYRLAPFNPNVIDTLGWLLVKQGDHARGTQLLRMASNLSPSDPAIRLHYAKALAKGGDKVAAKRELDILAKSDRAKSMQPEIEKLRGEL